MSAKLCKILTVIQARRGSTRLPDKIFLPLAGKPLLFRIFERVIHAQLVSDIVIATTTDECDDKVGTFCSENGINCFRGHPEDLLDRHYKAGLEYGAETVVKIPSDCPLICPYVIDNVLKLFMDNPERYDYVSNLHPATYPDGHDVEIMTMKSLEIAWKEASKDFEREHTTPFIWEKPDRFRIGNVEWETGLDFSMSHRMTIDYPEDYEFIKRIYDELHDDKKIFKLCDIMQLLDKKPEIRKLNDKYAGVNWYRHHLDELKTITKDKTKNTEP